MHDEGLLPSRLDDGHPNEMPFLGSWHVVARNVHTGEIVDEQEGHNIVTKVGRADVLALVFALSGSSVMCALGAGASSTAETVNDTRLTYEHILNGSRKLLTNTSGAALTNADIVDETVTVSGVTYYKKLTARAVFLTTDSNNGHPFREYGLFSLVPCPSTPTGTSGNMFNHFVAPNTITKDSSTEITVDVTIRV